MKRLSLVALAAVPIVASACFPSLDGLVGTSNDASVTADARNEDGSLVVATDAAKDADDASARWCKTHASPDDFCCDFDPDDVSMCGVSINTDGNGSLIVNRSVFESPPAALQVTVPPADGAEGAFARSHLEWNAKSTSLTDVDLSFSLRLDKIGTPNAVGLANVNFASGTKAWESRLNLDTAGRLYVSQFDPQTKTYTEPYHAPTALAVGTWTRVRFHTKLVVVGQATVDLEVDGKPLTSGLAMNPTLASGSLQLLIGITFAPAPTTGWGLHVDNLLVTPK